MAEATDPSLFRRTLTNPGQSKQTHSGGLHERITIQRKAEAADFGDRPGGEHPAGRSPVADPRPCADSGSAPDHGAQAAWPRAARKILREAGEAGASRGHRRKSKPTGKFEPAAVTDIIKVPLFDGENSPCKSA